MAAGQQMEAEELVDIPEIEKNADPFRHSKIARTIDGTLFSGYVEDIEVGQNSRERLYRIRYNDGDLEHFTADQVQQYLIAESKPEEMPVSKKPAMASEEEHEAVPPSSAPLAGKKPEAVASVEEEIEEQAEDVHVFKKPAAAKDHIDEEMGEEEEAEAEGVDDSMETSIPVVHKKPAIAQDEPEEEEEEDVEEEDEEEVKTVVSKKPAMNVEPVRKSIAKSPAKSPAKPPTKSPAKPPTKSPAKPPAKSPAKSPAKAKAKALLKKPAAK